MIKISLIQIRYRDGRIKNITENIRMLPESLEEFRSMVFASHSGCEKVLFTYDSPCEN